MIKYIDFGRPISPEDVWVLLKLEIYEVIRYDDVDLDGKEIKCLDDIYKKLYGVTRLEWLDYKLTLI